MRKVQFMVLSFFVLLLATSNPAKAIFKYPEKETPYLLDLYSLIADYSDYQIGDEFGKKPVRSADLKTKSNAFVRAAKATARLGGGTSFFLGKFGDEYMMATNHHVLPNPELCAGNKKAIFPLYGKSFVCKKGYGSWTDIDLALFSIEVDNEEDAKWLISVGRNFDFNAILKPGEELLTIGFGVFQNPGRELMANEDSDCKVFSGEDEMRFMGDPDLINPGPYKAWSFATGCDVSHGDSGSSMVDRNTGNVLGIIWTTATQKKPNIQNSRYLDELLRTQGSEIWSQLSYAVPAPKIKEFLQNLVSSGSGSSDDLAQIALLIQ